MKALHGDDEMDGVTVVDRDQTEHRLDATAVFAMIGAAPRTGDLGDLVGLDDKGFIVTGDDARRHQRFAEHRGARDGRPLLLETTRPGCLCHRGCAKRLDQTGGVSRRRRALVARSMHEALNRRRGVG